MNYLNHKCEHCGKKFTEEDDVVVCPVCGTPQHRECYEENNRCIHYDKHSEGYEWSASEENTDDGFIICDRCGTKNSNDSNFCKRCSNPLRENRYDVNYGVTFNNQRADEDTEDDDTADDSEEEFIRENVSFGKGMPLRFGFANLSDKEEVAENVTLSDVKKYVQRNTLFYSIIFKNLRSLNRSRFNFAACLFGGGWFIYRKQYRIGIILTLIMGICLCGYILTAPASLRIYNQIYSSGVSSDTEFYNVLMKEYSDSLIYFLAPSVFKLVQYAVMLISGFTANRCYYHHVVKKVRQAKEQFHTKEEVAEYLDRTGGVDTVMGYILFLGYVILSFLPSFMNNA